MTPYLVTGGAGFIGSHVVEALLAAGHQVRVLDNFSTGKRENLPEHPGLEVISGDIRNWKLVAQAVEGVVGVVHLAAQASVPYSIENPRVSEEINCLGFINLLDGLRQAAFTGRIIYASSSAVYGNKESSRPLRERDVTDKHPSPYAFEKWMNEKFADLYLRLYGLQSLGLRLFNVYGPRQEPSSPYSGVISVFMDKISRGETVPVHGDGEQTRDFIYVKDVADIVLKALAGRENGVVNVGTGKRTSLNHLVKIVGSACGEAPQVNRLGSRPGDIRHSCADIAHFKKVFEKHRLTPLQEGLTALAESLGMLTRPPAAQPPEAEENSETTGTHVEAAPAEAPVVEKAVELPEPAAASEAARPTAGDASGTKEADPPKETGKLEETAKPENRAKPAPPAAGAAGEEYSPYT